MTVLAVWLGKLTLLALRLLGRRGNALPGLVVEKVFPGYLARAMAGLPEGVVVVSGTNGKTTTTKMVATVLGRALPGADQRHRLATSSAARSPPPSSTPPGPGGCPTTSPSSSWTRPGRCASSSGVAPRRGAAAQRHARPARPLRRDRHHRRGCWARSPPRPPATSCSTATTSGSPRWPRGTAAAGQLLRRRAGAARAVPERRGALRRPGARVATAGRGRAAGAARRRHDPSSTLRIDGDRPRRRAARRGPAQRAERLRRRGAGADLRLRRRRRSPAGLRQGRSRRSAAARPSPSTAAGWCCSW